MATCPGVHLEVWQAGTGGIQVSISDLDETGAGGGYRIAGPKFCACHGSVKMLDVVLTKRDADEIRRYIDKVVA